MTVYERSKSERLITHITNLSNGQGGGQKRQGRSSNCGHLYCLYSRLSVHYLNIQGSERDCILNTHFVKYLYVIELFTENILYFNFFIMNCVLIVLYKIL